MAADKFLTEEVAMYRNTLLIALTLLLASPGNSRAQGAKAAPASSVAALAMDQSGNLWVAEGGGCGSSATTGAVWLSSDRGESWVRMPVFTPDSYEMTTAAAGLAVDSKRPGRVLVRAGSCCDKEGCEGGEAYLSTDGGKSWWQVVLDEHLPMDEEDDQGKGITNTAVFEHNLERFAVLVDGHGWFETGDGGGTWKKLTLSKTAGRPGGKGWRADTEGRQVTLGGCAFSASGKGVVRKCGDGAEARIFPTSITDRGPASALTASAGKVTAARLTKPGTDETVANLTEEQVARLNKALSRGEPAWDWVVTSPPWPNALVLETATGRKLAVRFVNVVIRVSLLDPATGGKPPTDDIWRANSQDFTLHEEDADWFWGLMGGYLGSTKVKEYMPLKDPGLDINPKKGKKPKSKP